MTQDNPNADDTRRRARARASITMTTPSRYFTVANAAPLLDLTENALRARLRRAQTSDSRSATINLGGGITATKVGRSWRIRIP